MQLNFNQIVVPPGHQLLIKAVDWQAFETILAELGESRTSRLSYSQGQLEIMVPLAVHEDNKSIISDLVKILLEELNLEFRALGSTTFKNDQMAQAVEPDECFYIRHEIAIRGKDRIDLTVDPPPDLSIEIDLTSRTHFGNYEALGVPELWRYNGKKLEILKLQHGHYQSSEFSQYFPNLSLLKKIPECLSESKFKGRNTIMKAFRQWVKGKLSK